MIEHAFEIHVLLARPQTYKKLKKLNNRLENLPDIKLRRSYCNIKLQRYNITILLLDYFRIIFRQKLIYIFTIYILNSEIVFKYIMCLYKKNRQ